MAVQERLYTVDEFWELAHSTEYQDKRLELIEGELVVMSPTGGAHGVLALEFGYFLRHFLREHRLGYVTGAETGYVLFRNPSGKDTVRAPDVGFVAAHRLPNGVPDKYIPFAPDMAVEVVSPNDTGDEIQAKVQEYLRAGTPLIVFIYVKSRTVTVYTQMGVQLLTQDDVFDAGDVIPGFRLPLRDLFKVLDELLSDED